jgi:hypothetical protein
MSEVMSGFLRVLPPALLWLVYLCLAPLHAADLPRTRVEVVSLSELSGLMGTFESMEMLGITDKLR